MKNHLTDQQIRDIRNKFEDNLFYEAYYSEEDANNDFLRLGKKNKDKTSDPSKPRKKFDLKKIANDGLGLIQKAKDILKGNAPAVSGDYEGTQYEATINTEEDQKPDKPQDKKIMGMPPPVFYTAVALILAMLIFLLVKLTSKQPQIKQL